MPDPKKSERCPARLHDRIGAPQTASALPQAASAVMSNEGHIVKSFDVDRTDSLHQSSGMASMALRDALFPPFTKPGIPRSLLYTPEQRRRRDLSVWTLVQGILAPVQFLIFLISLVLVMRCLATGEGSDLAALSVVVKTIALYTIMITGCLWERQVFGCFLFAPAFFWEDVFSMVVLALHTGYLFALLSGMVSLQSLMVLALAAYASYVINAAQFLLKLRAARLETAISGAVS